MENKNRLILGPILGVCCFLYTSNVFAQLSATEQDRLFASDTTLKFVDGGRGDHDDIANGVIEDPGAPGVIIISDTLFEDGFEE